MKYLGIDYGEKRVGLAVSEESSGLAFPLEVVATAEILEAVKRIVAERRIGALVVGDTRSLTGSGNPVSEKAQKFVDMLARETGLPVSRAFEAWSSVEASRYAPEGKGHDDAAAAAIILQRFLDMKGAT